MDPPESPRKCKPLSSFDVVNTLFNPNVNSINRFLFEILPSLWYLDATLPSTGCSSAAGISDISDGGPSFPQASFPRFLQPKIVGSRLSQFCGLKTTTKQHRVFHSVCKISKHAGPRPCRLPPRQIARSDDFRSQPDDFWPRGSRATAGRVSRPPRARNCPGHCEPPGCQKWTRDRRIPSDRDRKSSDRDRKSSDRDRKSSDRDRKSSDRDRKSSDHDRKSSDSDRKSSDRDRKSSDRDRGA